jgi:D-3-phosphoglycerate dehydrogenase
MPEYKILITDGLDEHGQSILRASARVDEQKGLSEADLVKVIADYDGLIVRGQTRVTASILEVASRLKVVGRAGVGVDNIDLDAAKQHGIAVVNAPTSTTIAVAELAIGLLLAVAREIPRADASMKQGGWLKKEFEGVELSGKTLGVIGYGRIGTEVGRRAAAFGMSLSTIRMFRRMNWCTGMPSLFPCRICLPGLTSSRCTCLSTSRPAT